MGRENEYFGTVSCPSGRDAHRPGGASSGGKVYDQDRITGDDKSELYCPHRPVIAVIFGWITVGTIGFGKLGKYFIAVAFVLVAVLMAVIVISQKHDAKRMEEFRNRTGYAKEKKRPVREDDTHEFRT